MARGRSQGLSRGPPQGMRARSTRTLSSSRSTGRSLSSGCRTMWKRQRALRPCPAGSLRPSPSDARLTFDVPAACPTVRKETPLSKEARLREATLRDRAHTPATRRWPLPLCLPLPPSPRPTPRPRPNVAGLARSRPRGSRPAPRRRRGCVGPWLGPTLTLTLTLTLTPALARAESPRRLMRTRSGACAF